MTLSLQRRFVVILCAIAVLTVAPFGVAHAETDAIDSQPDELQRAVEESAAAYADATRRVKELSSQMKENAARIEELNAQISSQRSLCETSLRELYKFHRDDMGIISMVFSSDDIGSFLANIDYFNRVQEAHSDDLKRLDELCTERQEAQANLERAAAEADEQQNRAQEAFDRARAKRDEAQAAARELALADARQSLGSAVTPDGADWSMDRAAFINAWKGRLDDYLAGSPLAGHGAQFAAAAWENGIDPRFSAAISCMESSKGRYCFLPYNAWGWGQVSWGSWDEAIAAHARGLARGYGYSLTLAGAKKYCPPNWEHWYATVGSEMARI